MLSFADIRLSTRRVPFTENEIEALSIFLGKTKAASLDLWPDFDVYDEGDPIMKTGKVGYIVLASKLMLQTRFVFVKCDAGKGFFGGQKAVYNSYLASAPSYDQYTAGATFKHWVVGLTSINNIYRELGYLSGAS